MESCDQQMISDFPKVECPFVRKVYSIDKDDFKKHGSAMGLRVPEVYLVTPEVTEGYEWVLDSKDTIAVEKLHGSNVGIVIENNRLVHIQNRKNIVDPFQINGGRSFLMEGIFGAMGKGYIANSGKQYGESLGPKLNGNLYKLPMHLWYPFEKAQKDLRYASFHKYDKGFWNWSEWFRLYLKSLFYCRYFKIPFSDMFQREDVPFAEGVVFYNDTLTPLASGMPRMAKLRRDMFFWHYSDKIKILGLEDAVLEQAKTHSITVKGYLDVL